MQVRFRHLYIQIVSRFKANVKTGVGWSLTCKGAAWGVAAWTHGNDRRYHLHVLLS